MTKERKVIDGMLREFRARLMIEMGKDAFEKMQEDIKILAEHDLNYFMSDPEECVHILTKVRGGHTDEEIEIYKKVSKIMEKLDTFYKKPCTYRHLVDEVFRCDITDEWCMPEKCPTEEEEVK